MRKLKQPAAGASYVCAAWGLGGWWLLQAERAEPPKKVPRRDAKASMLP